jgi:type II secretory pathway component PulJ
VAHRVECRVSPVTRHPSRVTRHASPVTRHAFTLVEILVVVVLMALIVLALMAVFSSTQAAFRASITQTDVLEGGRAAMGLIKSDLESMTPSFGVSNGAVNFCVITNQYQYQSNSAPLVQSLTGSGSQRNNVLEKFFILTRQNTTWTGTGYVVDTTSTNYFNPLYRFSITTNVMARNVPAVLYTNFLNASFTNMSHLMDGVIHLTVRAYDPNGYWMTNVYEFYNGQFITNRNVWFSGPAWGEVSFYMFSNTLPASVEIQLGLLEDRTLQRAQSISVLTQSNYLAQHAGQVHLFRQRFPIRNVDPSAYQ